MLYQRLKIKHELFFAAMSPPPPDLTALLGDAQADREDGEAHLRVIARRLCNHLRTVAPSLLHLATRPAFGLTDVGRAHSRIGSEALGRALSDRVRLLQRAGQISADADAEGAAATLVSTIHGLALHEAVGGGLAPLPEDQLERILGTIWRGLRP